MVSNALSTRRKFLRRPKVCKTLPNPGRCEPPPPPPPDDEEDWAADVFVLHWNTQWWDKDLPMVRVGEEWHWSNALVDDPIHIRGDWTVDVATHTAELILLAQNKAILAYSAKEGIPVTWGVETSYLIDEWDVIDPPYLLSRAIFLF